MLLNLRLGEAAQTQERFLRYLQTANLPIFQYFSAFSIVLTGFCPDFYNLAKPIWIWQSVFYHKTN